MYERKIEESNNKTKKKESRWNKNSDEIDDDDVPTSRKQLQFNENHVRDISS